MAGDSPSLSILRGEEKLHPRTQLEALATAEDLRVETIYSILQIQYDEAMIAICCTCNFGKFFVDNSKFSKMDLAQFAVIHSILFLLPEDQASPWKNSSWRAKLKKENE